MKIDFIQAIIFGLIPVIAIYSTKSLGGLGFLRPDLSSPDVVLLNDDEFKKLSIRYGLSIFFVTVLISSICFGVFLFLSKLYYSSFFHEKDYLPIIDIAFALPAMFLGLVASSLPIEFFFQRKFVDLHKRYWKTYDTKYKFNGRKLNQLFAKVGILVCLLGFVYLLRCTSYLENKSVVIRKFGSIISKQYSVDDIKVIRELSTFKAPNGNIVHRINFEVTFKDNWTWNIDDEPEARAFLAILSDLSALKISKD